MENIMRIMGIDPGTNYMGYGIIEIIDGKPQPVLLGDIDLHKISDPHQKLRYIFERVQALTKEYKPAEVAFESPFFGENVQSIYPYPSSPKGKDRISSSRSCQR